MVGRPATLGIAYVPQQTKKTRASLLIVAFLPVIASLIGEPALPPCLTEPASLFHAKGIETRPGAFAFPA
jgi:hypothetical protein